MTDETLFPPLLDLSPGELEKRKQHLLSEIRREPERRRLSLPTIPPLRLRFAVPAVAAVCVAAAGAVVLFSGAFASSGTHRTNTTVWGAFQGQGGGMTVLPPPTLAQPLPGAQRTTLDAASADWGSPIVLPNTTLVRPSDAGSVWVRSVRSKTVAAAVSFPSKGVIVMYLRPTFSDPETQYRAIAQGKPGFQEVSLNGTPALEIAQNSDSTKRNFGVVEFQVNGSDVAVMGHYAGSTLESLALSILSQSGGSR